MDKPLWMWAIFIALVLVLLVFDLGVLQKRAKELSVKASLLLSAFYIAIGLIFGGWIWYSLGPESGKEYITGFLVEKSLALDNAFIISLIFGFFSISLPYQRRVLLWGIIGVIALRAIMIGLGAALISQFSWVMLIFAGFLVITGIKMLLMKHDSKPDISKNPILKWMQRHLQVTPDLHGEKFFVKQPHPASGKLVNFCTPLFLALVLIEFADLVFAVDSVPAIFALTKDPYIVYTSNIFAILGLRALYFALAAVVERFHYLKYALALVLIFIGGKVFVAEFLGIEKFPALISLGVTFGLLAGGVIFSLYKTHKQARMVAPISP